MTHEVSIFKIGWCYSSVCSCGRKFQWQDARRLEAVNTSLMHIEARGSMAEDDMWIIGDQTTENEVVKGWEVPVLALVVRSRTDIIAKTGRGRATDTPTSLAELVKS